MVGLGVGIDYALFLVTRHREFLAQGLDVTRRSVGRSPPPARRCVFAGGTVVIAILGLAVAGVPFMTAAGIAVSVIVLVMVAASLTPAARVPRARRAPDRTGVASASAPGGAARPEPAGALGRARLPPRLAVRGRRSTVLLVALAAPVLALRLGIPDDGTLPRRAPSAAPTTWSPGLRPRRATGRW